ncbi:glycosyltransferase [Inconstantimicrobium mannanitabidum]|uniref:Glycosyl transferase n=1 Tax=Inconstantimicrobium mannanitabidum TaxID=1604901 RepID=A0ACB5RF57_9CLOT|nr:glycosyltransferase [Clostridium sp. TW13]GKX67459.1 glycosyl transferase [Clostridium sp. TW13]
MENNLVSVIILSYKNLQYLKETIDSVLSQTYSDIEIILGDDGTEQFDTKFYEQYINTNCKNNVKKVIAYKNPVNLGIVKNANKAIKMSRGEYIKFIASDDTFYSDDVLLKMINYLNENDAYVLTSNILLCDSNMKKLDEADFKIKDYQNLLPIGQNPHEFFKLLCVRDMIAAPSVMFNKDLFDKYGYFNEKYKLVEDWPMWLKISRSGCKIHYLDIISVKYRSEVGVSSARTPNPIFIKDIIRCYEDEILPHKSELGYWLHKKIKWKYIRTYRLSQYNVIKKLIVRLINIDVILANRIKRLMIHEKN